MKNTMIMLFAELFCPNRCVSCGELGGILCDCCKKNWMSIRANHCLLCNKRINDARCSCCAARQFCLARRVGAIKRLINRYKFNSARVAASVFADMFCEIIPNDYIIVPLPTIPRHIRERGFDHIALLADRISRRNGCRVETLLGRAANTVQVGADSEKRKAQAASAYSLLEELNPEERYLLLDDVWTTGSSMLAAEKILRDGGARFVDYAVIAKSV